jgi:hypothetical protein
MKLSKPANDNFTERTCRLWKQRLARDLSGEEARQIAENVTGFFSILAQWARTEMPSPANDAGKAAASLTGEGRHER